MRCHRNLRIRAQPLRIEVTKYWKIKTDVYNKEHTIPFVICMKKAISAADTHWVISILIALEHVSDFLASSSSSKSGGLIKKGQIVCPYEIPSATKPAHFGWI